MESRAVPNGRNKTVRLGKNSDVVYNEEDVIGRGQFGTVYRGIMPASDTVVAVKLLKNVPSALMQSSEHTSDHSHHTDPQGCGGVHVSPVSPSAPSSFSATPAKAVRLEYPSELSILCDVRTNNCPNILRVFSIWNKRLKPTRDEAGENIALAAASPSSSSEGQSSYLYIMVTEYCEGGDLQKFMKARGSALPVHVARSFTYQLCNALLTLKRHRIVHRDVKPANLLLTSADCEVATLKLADFGMAKVAPAPCRRRKKESTHDARGEEGDDTSGTCPLFYSEMGTPMYMSPERLALKPYDYKADVYSAGMVLLEMMRGSCVQVKWESQLRSEVPRTIWQELRQYPPDKVPAWLELVQRMTAVDPGERYSVEDVLRHSWFQAEVGHPLPPLTIPLEENSGCGSRTSQLQQTQLHTPVTSVVVCADEGIQSTSSVDTKHSTTALPPPFSSAEGSMTGSERQRGYTDSGVVPKRTDASAAAPSSPSSSPSSCADGEVGERTPQATKEAALPGGESKSCLAESSKWMVLGVCAEVNVVHNVANGTYTGPPKPAVGTEGGLAAAISLPTSVAAAAFSLPPGCGPHIITNAVRALVDAAYLYVLQDELNAARGLTLVSYLMDLMQNGYAAYLKCIAYIGGTRRHTGVNSCSIGGHRLVVRDVSVLHNVWRQLMTRLHSAQVAYTARLPSHMLSSAAAWRQRLLGAPTIAGDDGEDAAAAPAVAEEEVRGVDMSEASMTLSEREMAMSAFHSATSTSKGEANAEPVTGARASLFAAPLMPPATERLCISTVCPRAEQLIFDKAVEYIQSEAVSMLMDSTSQPLPTSFADDLDATDCLEEEEATVRSNRDHSTPLPPHMSERLPTVDDQTMPPHRGVALLRVLLRRAVLTIAEVGLEAEKPKSARKSLPEVSTLQTSLTTSRSSKPLSDAATTTTTTTSISCEAVAKLAFVVEVPVFCTLDKVDIQTVENLLHTATRVFSSTLSSTG
ncbi:hypothetical protein JKF63_05059 [Porcisia hertigi]|uniref:Protein kinase domain-containing protein n=1 Tax=Porcisia hertigi TaxID=2761500 RepID=A0A836I5W1_9TRYP|nr:hypothetical protein JKF63_05059 [Porcisia hertigi]